MREQYLADQEAESKKAEIPDEIVITSETKRHLLESK